LEACTLDLLPEIATSTKFLQAYTRSQKVTRDCIEFMIIGLEDLIAEKQASGREKDLNDIKHLRGQDF
jgi:predicted nucleotidyltransferase